MSNLNAWDPWFKGQTKGPMPKDNETLKKAAEYLEDLDVEDWGCGFAHFKDLHDGGYVGIDGTMTPEVDHHVDLANYTSDTEGILLRHVLEHDHNFNKILENAFQSFTERMVVVVHTDTDVDETHVVKGKNGQVDVPDIAIKLSDITDYADGVAEFSVEKVNHETVIYFEKVSDLDEQAPEPEESDSDQEVSTDETDEDRPDLEEMSRDEVIELAVSMGIEEVPRKHTTTYIEEIREQWGE